MKNIVFTLIFFCLCSCTSENSKNKLFEEKIKKNLEDNAFKLNSSFNVIEIKVNKAQAIRLDSLYRELCYERLNELQTEFRKNNSKDYASLSNDKRYNELLNLKNNADTTLNGNLIWYYIKGTFTDPSKNGNNILYDSVVSYFDNNNNLLFNKLHFELKQF